MATAATKSTASRWLSLSSRLRFATTIARDWNGYLATGEGSVIGKRIEITAQRADGTEFPVELAVCLIQRSDPPVFTAYLRDLTRQKEAEDALAERARLADLTADVAIALAQGVNATGILQNCTEAIVQTARRRVCADLDAQ